MMMNKIRLQLANMIRWIPGTSRLCDWLAPILTVGQDASILNISENMVDDEEIDEEQKKKVKTLMVTKEYEPYDEEEKDPSFKHVTVSSSFLGLGTVKIKDEIGIKARSLKPYINNTRLINTCDEPKE